MHIPETILVVDAQANTRQLFKDLLEKHGYRVITAGNGQTALYAARREQPDLVLLDLIMPEMNGYHFLTQFRKECPTPVILLAPNEEEIDIALGLDLGADDCVTRPYRLQELLARIRALMRRNAQTTNHATELNINGLVLDETAHEVKVQGRLVDLTPIEFSLLSNLMQAPGQTFTRAQLVEHLLDVGYNGLVRTINIHIHNLRTKIETDPTQPLYIETVYGVGYRLRLGEPL